MALRFRGRSPHALSRQKHEHRVASARYVERGTASACSHSAISFGESRRIDPSARDGSVPLVKRWQIEVERLPVGVRIESCEVGPNHQLGPERCIGFIRLSNSSRDRTTSGLHASADSSVP